MTKQAQKNETGVLELKVDTDSYFLGAGLDQLWALGIYRAKPYPQLQTWIFESLRSFS
jgi:hypothetical protein